MSRQIECPVPITCPDIDLIFKKLNVVHGDLERLEKLLNSDLIRDMLYELNDILGYTGLLEKLRDANSQLREWGNDSNVVIEQLEEELEELQNT